MSVDRVAALCAGCDASPVVGYQAVWVGGARVWLERGYGYVTPTGAASEGELLAALVRARDVVVTGWRIVYGGQGYTAHTVARGLNARDLARYLWIRDTMRRRANASGQEYP